MPIFALRSQKIVEPFNTLFKMKVEKFVELAWAIIVVKALVAAPRRVEQDGGSGLGQKLFDWLYGSGGVNLYKACVLHLVHRKARIDFCEAREGVVSAAVS